MFVLFVLHNRYLFMLKNFFHHRIAMTSITGKTKIITTPISYLSKSFVSRDQEKVYYNIRWWSYLSEIQIKQSFLLEKGKKIQGTKKSCNSLWVSFLLYFTILIQSILYTNKSFEILLQCVSFCASQ